jgi:hypothetical protein
MTIPGILKPHKIPSADLKAVQAIYDKVESRPERYELNLYIVGEDEEPSPVAAAVAVGPSSGAGDETADASTSTEGSANQ